MNALIINIKSRYIKEETIKLTKKYFNEYEKSSKINAANNIARKKTNSSKNKNNRELHFYRFKNVFSKNY